MLVQQIINMTGNTFQGNEIWAKLMDILQDVVVIIRPGILKLY